MLLATKAPFVALPQPRLGSAFQPQLKIFAIGRRPLHAALGDTIKFGFGIRSALMVSTGTSFPVLHRVLGSQELERKPGYWGRIPYLFCLRALVAAGIFLRFWIHDPVKLSWWAYGIPLLCLIVAGALHLRPPGKYIRDIYRLIVLLDIAIISLAYYFTDKAESDFFLFYYLPIFTAAEYLRTKDVILVAMLSTIAFATVLFSLSGLEQASQTPFPLLLVRVFLPREVFYFALCVVSALILRRERALRERADFAQRQLQQLVRYRKEIDEKFDLAAVLQLVVKHAGDDVAASGVTGWLAEEESGNGHPRMLSSRYSRDDGRTSDLQSEAPGSLKFDVNSSHAIAIIAGGKRIGGLATSDDGPELLPRSPEYLRSLAELVAAAYERARLFAALREIGAAASRSADFNRKLDGMLDHLVDTLGFQYATISLVDSYKDTIRTIRGKGVPPGWILRSVHRLDSADIQAVTVRTQATQVFEGWNESFNWESYERYNHARLCRVFAPIVCRKSGACIGTIEAGRDKDRGREFVATNKDVVTELGAASGDSIAESAPHVFLELIAARAVALIRAHSASLHVFRRGKEFLVAGAGKVDKDFLQSFPPSENGIGQQAMAKGQPVVSTDLKSTRPDLWAVGVRALAAFPVSPSPETQGVLYIHFWHEEHHFSTGEIELVKIFVPQIAVAIQDSLLLQDVSKMDEQAWMVTGLQNVIRSLSSALSTETLMERLASDALYMLDAKNVTLYGYFQDRREVGCVVSRGGFVNRNSVRQRIDKDDEIAKIIGEGQNLFVNEVTKDMRFSRPHPQTPDQPRFVIREKILSTVVLMLKSPYDQEIVGCLFVNYDVQQNFDSPEKKGWNRLATSLASSAAVAIKTARLHEANLGLTKQALDRREQELAALRAIGSKIVLSATTSENDEVFSSVLDQVLAVLGPSGDVTLGQLFLWNNDRQMLELEKCKGTPSQCMKRDVPLGVGIIGMVAELRKPMREGDVRQVGCYVEFNAETRSELAVPIVDGDKLLGVINVEHRNVNAFSTNDETFLEIVAVQVAIAVRSGGLHQRIDQQLGQARCLGVIAARIQDSSLTRDIVLRLVLTGVTAREGLGFSRAILFELDPEAEELQGTIAIGALNQEGADETWRQVTEHKLDQLLKQAQEFGGAIAQGHADSPLGEFVRQFLKIPLTRAGQPLRACLQDNAPKMHLLHGRDFAGTPLAGLYQNSDDNEIAAVALKGRDRVLGLLLVDNRFLYPPRTIDRASEPILTAFAELAAMSIETAELRARLAEEAKLANWKDLVGKAIHPIKNRAESVESLVHETTASLEAIEIDRAKKQIAQLREEFLAILEKLQRISRYHMRPNRPTFQSVELWHALGKSIRESERHTKTPITPPTPLPQVKVWADSDQLPEIFDDLFINAAHALKASPRPPKIVVSVGVDQAAHMAVVEISDNGPGVAPEVENRMFQPYVSQKGSTGLGLAIIKELVEEHKGTIRYERRDGATFIIHLPLVAD